MTGQRILVTGATGGLGRHLAERLAMSGAQVVLHGRDEARTERLGVEVRELTGNPNVDTVVADLASMTECDRLAAEMVRRYKQLDVLVNNAGIGFGPPGSGREESKDGIELRFAVNYLACYRLTRSLLPLLIASAPARVVNIVSHGLPLDFSDPLQRRGYSQLTAYRSSKLAQVMFTFDLAEELRPHNVTVNAIHPASLMDTPMIREAGVAAKTTVEEGGDTVLRLVNDSDLNGITGRFFNGTSDERAHEQAYDPTARRMLHSLSEHLLRNAQGEWQPFAANNA